jgi:ADP-heptose:LPS heptosyltransferase
LRRHYAGSKVSLLVGSESAGLASAFADVDEVISFDVRRYRLDLAYRIRLIQGLRNRQFDLGVNPIYSREPSTDELLYCSSAKERIAFDGNLDNIDARTKAANNPYCTRIVPSHAGIITEVERNRQFVEQLTGRKMSLEESLPRITLSDTQMKEARQLLLSEGVDPEVEQLVVLFPGASNAIKMWPAERFAVLANRIAETYKVHILICGAHSDRATQEAVASRVSAPVARLAGKTDLLQLAAILKHSGLYIGNDTGPLHLAAAVGTPTLCILGGGQFGRFYPYGDLTRHRMIFQKMDCYQCNYHCVYDTVRCVQEISCDDVWREAQRMMQEVVLPAGESRFGERARSRE